MAREGRNCEAVLAQQGEPKVGRDVDCSRGGVRCADKGLRSCMWPRTIDAKRRAPPEPLQRGEIQRFSPRLVIEALEVGGQRLIGRQRWLE